MDKTGWITHCFGRFLIDLPPNAKINAGYYIRGNLIEKINSNEVDFISKINNQEKELTNKKHNTKGSMFVQKFTHPEGSVSLWSWEAKFSALMYRMNSYLIAKPGREFYHYSTTVTYDKKQDGINISNNLSKNLHSRTLNEIPTEPGFCMDGAYIAGDAFQSEALDIGITFPNHPGAFFSFSSSTGAEQDRLLDRVSGFLSGVAKLVVGIETLRKREREGVIPGDEYLVAGSGKGQRVYAFIWEFQGKDHSITEPYIRAGLEVGEAQKDEDDNLPPSPFKSDQEALQLWDTIIDSIRLRPTSSPRDDKVSLPPNSPYSADDYALHDFISGLSPKDDDWMNKL